MLSTPPQVSNLGVEGGRWLRLLTREEMVKCLSEALEQTLVTEGRMAPGTARRLRAEVMRNFSARVRARSRRVRGLSKDDFLRDVKTSYDTLLAQRARVLGEIEEARGNLSVEEGGDQGRVDILERRVRKLRAALSKMETDLADLARQAEIDPGLASIYKDVQGLSSEESERERKSALLTQIFEQNVALRRALPA